MFATLCYFQQTVLNKMGISKALKTIFNCYWISNQKVQVDYNYFFKFLHVSLLYIQCLHQVKQLLETQTIATQHFSLTWFFGNSKKLVRLTRKILKNISHDFFLWKQVMLLLIRKFLNVDSQWKDLKILKSMITIID